MDEASKNIQKAYELLGAIPVSGDAVELMAAAREHLRRAGRVLETHKRAAGEEAAGHGG